MKIDKNVVLRIIEKLAKKNDGDYYLDGKINAIELLDAINNIKPESNENNKLALMWIKGTWNPLYEKYTVTPPVVCYGKDIRHIAGLIKNGITVEQLGQFANKYFEIWKNGNDKFISHNEPSIGIFYSQINKLNLIKTDKPVKEL